MGVNLALNKNAASNSYVAPFSPGRAVDGRTQAVRRWVCAELPADLTVDLGAYYWINRIILKQMEVAGWSEQYNLRGYILECSTDNLSWNQFYSKSGNKENTDDISFVPQPARWVRLLVLPGGGLDINPNVASLVEMEVYECPNDPYLNNLAISSGTLSPAFGKKTFAYTAEVENSVLNITVTPTAEAAGTSITVNNINVQNGRPCPAITLESGINTIVVQATNGPVEQKYTISVTKKDVDLHLSNLTMEASGINIPLNPGFSPTTMHYTADVMPDNESVTVTPSAANATGVCIKVNGVSVVSGICSQEILTPAGTTEISIEVSPDIGGSCMTYGITVTRANS